MSAVFSQTLIRRRAETREDAYGNIVADWENATDTPTTGWSIDAGDTTQNITGRDETVVNYTARKLSLTEDVASTDRIIFEGEEYEVFGHVLRQPGPTARTSHTIMRLTRGEG